MSVNDYFFTRHYTGSGTVLEAEQNVDPSTSKLIYYSLE